MFISHAKPTRVAILGSTGSIGVQTLDVISEANKHEEKFKVVALTANSNSELLSEQVNIFKPEIAHIIRDFDTLKDGVNVNTKLLTGYDELLNICKSGDYDILVMGISGCAGIEPTVVAANANKRIALANKESVVSAGNVLRKIISSNNCTIIPVDSEHNAIYQCLPLDTVFSCSTISSYNHFPVSGKASQEGHLDASSIDLREAGEKVNRIGITSNNNVFDEIPIKKTSADDVISLCRIPTNVINSIRRVILTSSGGPFRSMLLEDYGNMKMSDGIKHPVWSMGSKITIDSSTMMNKGLEVLEAHYLFGVSIDAIDIYVHPECIIHSMVEYVDNSIISQMYLPDMKLPIIYSLNWPYRKNNSLQQLDLNYKTLSFYKPDFNQFPCLKLSYEVGRKGGLYPAVLNGANDKANELFRNNLITFNQLFQLINDTVNEFNGDNYDLYNIIDILEVDRWSKQNVLKLFNKYY